MLIRGILLAATLLTGFAGPGAAQDKRKPNVVIFLADDEGYGELGCQGNREIPTPHIDSIAASGTRFTAGYVSGPYCGPTRAGLMTGRYQTRFGREFNEGPGTAKFGLPIAEKRIANRLRALGYATCAVVKWHLGNGPEFRLMKRCFDEVYGTLANTPYLKPNLADFHVSPDLQKVQDGNFYTTDAYADRAVDWIGKNKDKAFSLVQDIGEANDLTAEQAAKVKELMALWNARNAEQIAPLWGPAPKQPKKAAGDK